MHLFLKTMQQGGGREGVQRKGEGEKRVLVYERGTEMFNSTQPAPRLLNHHTKQFFLPHSISPMLLLCPKLHFDEVFFTFGAELNQIHHIDREELHNGEGRVFANIDKTTD